MYQNQFTLGSLAEYMLEVHGECIEVSQVGYEAIELEYDEVDPELIPEEVLLRLPNPTLYYTYTYENDKEWMIVVAVEANTYRPLFLVCTCDGVVVEQRTI